MPQLVSREDAIISLLNGGFVVARVKGDGSEPLSVVLRQG